MAYLENEKAFELPILEAKLATYDSTLRLPQMRIEKFKFFFTFSQKPRAQLKLKKTVNIYAGRALHLVISI